MFILSLYNKGNVKKYAEIPLIELILANDQKCLFPKSTLIYMMHSNGHVQFKTF